MNIEPNHPKSSYVHKDRLGKLKAGPVWDFDWYTYVPSKSNSYQIKNAIYYGRLFEDPLFVTEVKNRWALYKTSFESIPSYVDTVAARIKKLTKLIKRCGLFLLMMLAQLMATRVYLSMTQ